ncbi:MAG: hypothetical protein LBN24_13760 [Mediterranea sp.]|jgi:hypothetical protein|nr:hypothetical protein [Mediterranea sp.]
MKSNKKLTYLLLVLSVVVWSTAGWKVYKAFGAQAPLPPAKKTVGQPPVAQQVALLLNYKDPFLGGYADNKPSQPTVPSASTAKRSVKAPPTQLPPPEETPNIRFKGVMQVGKSTLAILQTAGGTISLKAGETVDSYKLAHIDDRKIVLRKGSKKYEIPIQ